MKWIYFFIALLFSSCIEREFDNPFDYTDKAAPEETQPTFGEVRDIDGNLYKTVTIGNLTWMAENLKTSRYCDGTAIPRIPTALQWSTTASGAYNYVNNDTKYENIYGKVYNWFAVTDPKNICPCGWKVPSRGDWEALENLLGTSAGNKLKEKGTAHWQSPNHGATNESGFTALPGDMIPYNGYYTRSYVSYYGYWWTSFSDHEVWGQKVMLTHNSPQLQTMTEYKNAGLYVRCVKVP